MEMHHYRPKRFHRRLHKLAHKSRREWYQFLEVRDDDDQLSATVDLTPKQPWWTLWFLGEQPGTSRETAIEAIEEFLLIHAKDVNKEDAESLAMLDQQMKDMGLDQRAQVRTLIHSLIKHAR
ncbi:MAG: hypothetical protein CMO81_05540 [Waddliaceae bacterium]|nr:hypothetical protein [Waddliaceae bacterium]